MRALWEFLENFYAGVYVADINTYELIYMNAKAREWFNIPSKKAYKKKKCYSILRNFRMPCPFCTNTQLIDDQLYEWDYYNPVINKTFHLKDYIVQYENKKYRVEIAIPDDAIYDSKTSDQTNQNDLNPDFFINKCLMATHSVSDPSASLELMLQYIGLQLGCESIFLYERKSNGAFFSTYHWTHVATENPISLSFEIEHPQHLQSLYRNEVLIFSDNDTRLPCVSQFSTQPFLSDIHTLILSPILSKGKIIALLRLDNPTVEHIRKLSGAIKVLSHFIGSILLRRDLMTHLEELSYHDSMTQLLNRHALNQYTSSKKFLDRQTVGLIYCDLIGLKRINDNLGHNNGDRLIMQASHILTELFSSQNVYRIGGDEFLVVCQDISQKDLEKQVAQLRSRIAEDNCALSIGSIWSDSPEDNFSQLITSADDSMYRDKLSYYENQQAHEPHIEAMKSTAFQSFLQNYYFDAETFFHSIAMPGAPFYLYCGDVQQNIYYISDNLRDTFNFDSNLVYDFVGLLEQRIYEPDRQLHIKDTQDMFREKRTTHSVRYRIFDKDGQLIWIHCRGTLTWDDKHEKPLFFSGSMISLTNESEVDPVTGLLNLSCALKDLAAPCRYRTKLLLLCFNLRNFSDINLSLGRSTGDAMLREIANHMELELGEEFSLFRLDGVHFLVMTQQDCDACDLSNKIRQIILGVYRRNDIHIMYPCAIGVLHAPQDGTTPQELINNILLATQNAKKTPSADFVEFSTYISKGYREQTDISMALNYSVNHGFQGFRIVLQPQVIASTGEIFGGEVLLRWNNRGQDVPPSKFIPILEQLGLIVPVGKWIITKIMQMCQKIFLHFPDFKVSFNVSYLQILDPTFFDYIQNSMLLYDIPGCNLMIELTETHFDEMPDYLENFIQQCDAVGISFVLDDFGTAYSSLHMLLQYPADLIKLDRTLMCELTSSPEKLNFMMSIIYACHRFGKKVCVEGVETEDDLQIVRQTECDYIQGFYFYKPLELSDFFSLLQNDHHESISN